MFNSYQYKYGFQEMSVFEEYLLSLEFWKDLDIYVVILGLLAGLFMEFFFGIGGRADLLYILYLKVHILLWIEGVPEHCVVNTYYIFSM
jgi:hypothetical protein